MGLVLALGSLAGSPAGAQPRVVVLTSNMPEALVYADSLWLGRAGEQVFTLPPTAQRLRLVSASPGVWSVAPREALLDDIRTDTLHLTLHFPYQYQIESIPFGAPVYRSTPQGRVLLGETPLQYTQDQPLQDTLLLDLHGYLVERIVPGTAQWNRHTRTLRPVDEQVLATPALKWDTPRRRNRWIDYAALGTSLVSGVVAVHYKIRADHRYDRYLENGDPTLRPDIERYDRYSGIALGVMQGGLGLVALRLVLR
jgi:hypothetical protein